MIENLVCMTTLVLLPIIPAYILYRTLPSRAMVKGPFKGLNIQLSGAFGGYFLVLLVVFSFFYTRLLPLTTQYEIWKVSGPIGLEGITTSPIIKSATVFIRPPDPEIHEDGTFDIYIPIKRESMGVRRDFGSLIVDYPDYQAVTIDLNEEERPGAYHWDKEHKPEAKEIKINELILLKKAEEPTPPSSSEEPQPN